MARVAHTKEWLMANIAIDTATGCWIWQGEKTDHALGYGRVRIRRGGKSKVTTSHKFAYVLLVGEVPAGMVVRHKCGTGPCCNPSHLELGTTGQNNKDTYMRFRRPTALSEESVRMIRDSTKTARALAAELGVSDVSVGQVRRGKTWGHIK